MARIVRGALIQAALCEPATSPVAKIKKAMIDIHHDLLNGQVEGKMLIQVHDELVFETPKSRVDALSELVRRRMEHAMALDVPIVVDLATGSNWAESK